MNHTHALQSVLACLLQEMRQLHGTLGAGQTVQVEFRFDAIVAASQLP
jgi:hypothetical protein